MRRAKLNNKGSAIVTVIVVTAFITILATTILYITSRNYMVKQNDYQSKQTFYQAEQTLDDLKAMLANDVSAACEYAYKQTMINYVRDNSSNSRAVRYKKAFVDYMDALWESGELPDGAPNTHAYKKDDEEIPVVNSLIKEYSAYFNKDESEIENHIINTQRYDGGTAEDGENTDDYDEDKAPDIGFEKNEDKGQFVIKDIVVRYADEKGYVTYIKTDIVMNAPAYNWGNTEDENMDETLRMSDYIVYRNWEKY